MRAFVIKGSDGSNDSNGINTNSIRYNIFAFSKDKLSSELELIEAALRNLEKFKQNVSSSFQSIDSNSNTQYLMFKLSNEMKTFVNYETIDNSSSTPFSSAIMSTATTSTTTSTTNNPTFTSTSTSTAISTPAEAISSLSNSDTASETETTSSSSTTTTSFNSSNNKTSEINNDILEEFYRKRRFLSVPLTEKKVVINELLELIEKQPD